MITTMNDDQLIQLIANINAGLREIIELKKRITALEDKNVELERIINNKRDNHSYENV